MGTANGSCGIGNGQLSHVPNKNVKGERILYDKVFGRGREGGSRGRGKSEKEKETWRMNNREGQADPHPKIGRERNVK